MDNSYRRESDEIEIDLGEVIAVLWHRMWLIVICGILAGAAGFLISNFLITDLYESTTTVYILNKENSSTGTITYSDVQLGTQLTKDYVQMIQSRSVLDTVIAENELDLSYKALNSKTKVAMSNDTRIISITVTDEDPAMAQYLADEIRKVAAKRIEEVMNIEAVNTVDEADLPTTPTSPSVRKWTAIGFLLGAFACAGITLVRFMLDDTIKTSDDVERYLGISTLGMIPVREEEDTRKKRKSRHKSSGSASKAKSRSGNAGLGDGTVIEEAGEDEISFIMGDAPESTGHAETAGTNAADVAEPEAKQPADAERSAETTEHKEAQVVDGNGKEMSSGKKGK